MRFISVLVLAVLLVLPNTASAQLRISFAGPPQGEGSDTPVPIGSYDEAVDDVLEICLPCLVARDGENKIRFAAWWHRQNEHPGLPDTEGLIPGTGWRCIAFLQPGDVVVGYQDTETTYPWHWVAGHTWCGRHPSEYTSLKVVLYSPNGAVDTHVYGWIRTFEIPIVWTGTVPTEESTWGRVKAEYK